MGCEALGTEGEQLLQKADSSAGIRARNDLFSYLGEM